jgi:hypothetical protein
MLNNTSSPIRTSQNLNALNNLDLALRCAEAGLYVLPCNPADRKPLIKWRHGKDLPTTDPKLIRKWWGPKKWPRALIGIDRGVGGLAYFGTRFTVNNTGNKHYQQDPDTPDLLEALRTNTMPVVPEFFVKILRPPEEAKAEEPKGNDPDPWAQAGTGQRAQSWAAAALNGLASDLAAMPKDTGRNIELNNAAFRMGTMIANDWIARDVVEGALTEAVKTNGLVKEARSTARDERRRPGRGLV